MNDESARFLEALGLSAEPPTPRFFEELFLRFSMRFPYESLTLRKSWRDPAAVFDDFVEMGIGSVGFERARAFLGLARELLFRVRPLHGAREALEREVESSRGRESREGTWGPHAAILVDLNGREFLLDPALPVPILLPLDPAGIELPSPAGGLSLHRSEGMVRLTVNARGRVRERSRFDLAAAPADLFDELGRTERNGLRPHEALRFYDDRQLRFRAGKIDVLDRWSRLEYGVEETGRPEMLEQVFLLSSEAPRGEEAGDALDSRESEGSGSLWVYDASELGVDELKARLANPVALLALSPVGTRFDELRTDEGGWSWRLTDEAEVTLRRESVRLTSQGVAIETLEGESPIARRDLSLTREATGTRVTMRATLSRPVPPRGLAESVRKTLVFHLASELLALSRDIDGNESQPA